MAEHISLEAYLKDLEEIVNIDSGSDDIEGCHQMANWFASKLGDVGFQVAIGHDGLHPYVEARHFSRSRDDSIDIMFLGHMDTVFPKGTAAERPFTIDEEGLAHGPGSADMKSGSLLALYLGEAIIKAKLPINLCIALNSDEEIGSADSMEWMRRLGTEAKYCFNFEPGRPNGDFVKERKGVNDYLVKFKGVAAHAGIEPEKGASAIVEMARWIDALTNLNAPKQGTTLNPGIVKGGTASNVIAEEAEMVIDMRYTSLKEMMRVEKSFDEMAANPKVDGVKAEWTRTSSAYPMVPNEKTEKLMTLMWETAVELGIDEPAFASTGGGSDSNNLGGLEVSIMDACGPMGGFYHSDKEFMIVRSVEPRFALLYNVIKKIQRNILQDQKKVVE